MTYGRNWPLLILVGALLLGFSVAGARPAAAPGPILVVVAHPDDEVLGMAGVIVNAGFRGRSVYVAVVTNGDAFASTSGRSYCEAADGVSSAAARTGLTRNKETIAAMTLLGVSWASTVSDSKVFFLGYPDGGLASIARVHSPWTGDRTGLHRTYADDGDGSNATCNGDFRFLLSGEHSQLSADALAADFDALVTMVDPSDIYTHVGFDSHSDHTEVYRQVIASLERTGLAPAMHTTLIHPEDRSDCLGEWPNPSLPSVGGNIHRRFTPASDFTAPPKPSCVGSATLSWGSWGPPTEWVEVPAPMQRDSEAANLKWRALSEYGSQVAWCPGACDYFRAFVKRREFFWLSGPDGFQDV